MDHAPGDGIWLDVATGRIGRGDRLARLTGKWDALFLAQLLPQGLAQQAPALGALPMQRALEAAGLERPLAANEWDRIVQRLNARLAALGQGLDRPPCISHPPRGKTTGPWRLEGAEGLHLRSAASADGAAAPHELPDSWRQTMAQLQLSEDGRPLTAVRLADRLKQGVEALWKALPERALELLADDVAWGGESTALAVLRRLRLAEVQRHLGRPAQARATLQQADRLLQHPGLRAVFEPHLRLVLLRTWYAEHPAHAHQRVQAEVRRELAQRSREGDPVGDVSLLAEQLHLFALCERRRLEQELAPAHPGDPCGELLRAFHAAFLLMMLVRSNDRAQHVCANLAYAHQKLAGLLGDPHWELAVEWHVLSFGMHVSFCGTDNSAWEAIYIGEFWLGAAEARAAFARRRWQAGWNDLTPDQASFYTDALRVARALNDPRQLAYTLLNRYRFLLREGGSRAAAEALAELLSHLDAQPAMRQLLHSEGYVLPRRQQAMG